MVRDAALEQPAGRPQIPGEMRPRAGGAAGDSAGAELTALSSDDVAELERILTASGLAHVSLQGRYTVIFVYPGMGAGEIYPDLAGCTAEVCTFADGAANFARHGIQLVGLSTEATVPEGDFLSAFPFPVGRLPVDAAPPLIEIVDKGAHRFAARTSFVVFPDGTGVRISGIRDSTAHVPQCLDVALRRRLEAYRRAIVTHLQGDGGAVRPLITLRDFLPNGADSVAISRVEARAELVCKMADPRIVAEEAGYMDRINRLLITHGRPPLFPAVVGICTGERPGWYLMEAANPAPLDQLLFEDDARTRLRLDRRHLLTDALAKLANLYELTFRAETPRVARYHYLDRFQRIPGRQDFRDTFAFVFGVEVDLPAVLQMPAVLEGGFVCRSYDEQMRFLQTHVEGLVQPVGAYLHGDVHLPNMLLDRDGGSVVFIDPRIIWDGNDAGDPGFGDPLYDYATLLHSLHYMSAILRAIEEGYAEALLTVDAGTFQGQPALTVRPGLLSLTDHPTVRWYIEWMAHRFPLKILGPNWLARLHVGTANATLGWLKYARSVKNRHAWLAIFIGVLYHLELAHRSMEQARSGATAR